MKKLLIIIAALPISLASFGQTKVNKRIMLDSLNNKASASAIRDGLTNRISVGIELSAVERHRGRITNI